MIGAGAIGFGACISCRGRMNRQLIQTAGQHGFGLVDIRVTFERVMMPSRDPVRPDPPAGVRIRPVEPGDLAGLAGDCPDGARGKRVFSTIHIFRVNAPKTSIRPGSRWKFRAAPGPSWLPPRQPISLWVMSPAIWSRRASEGQIGLVGCQARRFGEEASEKIWFWRRWTGSDTEAREVTVVTQGKNRAAQRLYQQCGFMSRDLQLWYHKWYPIFGLAIKPEQPTRTNGPKLFNSIQPILAPGAGIGAYLPDDDHRPDCRRPDLLQKVPCLFGADAGGAQGDGDHLLHACARDVRPAARTSSPATR